VAVAWGDDDGEAPSVVVVDFVAWECFVEIRARGVVVCFGFLQADDVCFGRQLFDGSPAQPSSCFVVGVDFVGDDAGDVEGDDAGGGEDGVEGLLIVGAGVVGVVESEVGGEVVRE
jgi:hypothetical protein